VLDKLPEKWIFFDSNVIEKVKVRWLMAVRLQPSKAGVAPHTV
jgi:hypothetical protein